jgi:hypothetical protein
VSFLDQFAQEPSLRSRPEVVGATPSVLTALRRQGASCEFVARLGLHFLWQMARAEEYVQLYVERVGDGGVGCVCVGGGGGQMPRESVPCSAPRVPRVVAADGSLLTTSIRVPLDFSPLRNRGALAAEVPLFLDVLAAHGMNPHVVEPGLALLRK